MTKLQMIEPVFVEKMPDHLEDGKLYISEQYKIALHNCCCGCGMEVSSPLTPTEYTLTNHGDLVSICPSIGNHDYPCGSHYVIEDNKILWAGAMSRSAIERGRQFDRELKRPSWRRRLRRWFHLRWAQLRRLLHFS
jgi:hypothetical protein